MARILVSLIFAAMLFLWSPDSVFAQVVINEVYPNPPNPTGSKEGDEFIELYNTGDEPVDINGYILGDETNKDAFTISRLPALDPGDFVYFIQDKDAGGTGIQLNNSNDTVYLTIPGQDPISTEYHDFDSSKGMEGKSWARYPDGIGEFAVVLDPKPGGPNVAPPTPTPGPTSTPTPKPTPTLEPTSTPVSTITPKPSATRTPTPKPSNEPKDTENEASNVLSQSNEIDKEISGQNRDENAENGSNESKVPIVAYFFVLGGVCFTIASGYLFYQKRKDTL